LVSVLLGLKPNYELPNFLRFGISIVRAKAQLRASKLFEIWLGLKPNYELPNFLRFGISIVRAKAQLRASKLFEIWYQYC
ncbi:MAG: hypothetical protein SWX82_18545, partial [Cyanobacteriota bacterium]|nr:hypothetical protein [Cyanobacteriota bacterium]